MSANLKRSAARLLKFAKLKKTDAKKFLKSVSRNIINALSEIAFNIREGVVNVSTRIKNSKLVKALAEKRLPLKNKYRLLCAAVAPVVVQSIVASVIKILEVFKNG